MLTDNSDILQVDMYQIPEQLTNLDQWLCWDAVATEKVNEHGERVRTKVPCTPFHDEVSTTDSSTWSSFEKVEKAYNRGRFDGIGFVFSPDDNIVGLDLDNHFDYEKPLTPFAKELMKITYVELSPSGTGAHAFFIGKLPEKVSHRYKENGRELEIYDKERFFTVTGHSIGVDEILDDQSFIDGLVDKYFKYEVIESQSTDEVTYNVDTDFIKERMLRNDKVKKLFVDGDLSEHENNNSQADLALCNHLAFWTGRNAKAMDELFRESALYRGKWDEKRGHKTYGEITIQKSIEGCTDIYKPYSAEKDIENYDVWDDVVDYDIANVPIFPKDIFPQWIEDYIDAVSRSTQTPRDMSCQAAITALSTTTSKKYYIQVTNDWLEPVNTYCMTLMPPGSRKSAVFKHMMKPIQDYELLEMKSSQYEVKLQSSKIKALEKAVETAEKNYAKNYDDPHVKKALEMAVQELENTEILTVPRFLMDDATPEIIAKRLEENKERIAIVSAEGGIMQQFKGRYSDMSNLDIYLKGHSGDTAKVDRMSRDTVILDEPLITIGIFGQPSIIRNVPDEFHEKGLMARFLYSMPPDNVGDRLITPPPIGQEEKQVYFDLMKELMSKKITDNPTIIRPNSKANAMILKFRTEFESRFRKGGMFSNNDNLRAWADKYVGALMRVAALLQIAYDISENIKTEWLTPEALNSAIRLDNYYIAHARKAFDISFEDTTTQKNKLILEKIIEMKDEEIIKRSDVWNKVRRQFSNSKELDYSLRELEERNFIKYKEEELTPGARKTKHIKINPIL